MRSNTGAPGFESSRSRLKYPSRSNCTGASSDSSPSDGSSRQPVSTSSEPGFSPSTKSVPSGRSSGCSSVNSVSYSRTSASTACAADTQWIVDFTLRPSMGWPSPDASSQVARSATTFPDASLSTPVQRIR